jgi:hypothetical protein
MRLLTATPFLCAALALASLPARAAPPAAPHITVGADIKQLQFDWDAVAGGTSYELWFKASDGADWVKYTQIAGTQPPRFRISASVHLLDWRVARYRVAACNASGCTNSNEVTVGDLPLDAMGYFKPTGAGKNRWFGGGVAVSADGKTFATLSGETIGSAQLSAVVHVYRKTTPTSGWRREARLTPSSIQSGTNQSFTGSPLALSADGNLLVLGLFAEDALGPNTPPDTGAVYLFRRAGTTWHLEQKLVGEARYNNYFGFAIDVDDAGSTLAIWRRYLNYPSGPATTDIFRHTDGGWVFDHTVPHVPSGKTYLGTCYGMALSGDGRTLVRSCNRSTGGYFVQVYDVTASTPRAEIRLTYSDQGSIDCNYDGTRLAVREAPFRTAVYAWNGSEWILDGTLIGNEGGNTQRKNISMSGDGKFVAMGNVGTTAGGTGPVYPPYIYRGQDGVGGVFVFERKTAGWKLRRLVKPGAENPQSFGQSVALGDIGRILAVGAPMESSAATGINGDRTDTSEPERGAVWLY